VVTRLWFGSATFDKADDYAKLLKETILPEIRRIKGYRGAYVIRRELSDGVEFGTITLWESMEAVREFAGERPEVAVVPPKARELLREFDKTVKIYDIVLEPSR
jgi:heme-degrading monooxygenase HmoA